MSEYFLYFFEVAVAVQGVGLKVARLRPLIPAVDGYERSLRLTVGIVNLDAQSPEVLQQDFADGSGAHNELLAGVKTCLLQDNSLQYNAEGLLLGTILHAEVTLTYWVGCQLIPELLIETGNGEENGGADLRQGVHQGAEIVQIVEVHLGQHVVRSIGGQDALHHMALGQEGQAAEVLASLVEDAVFVQSVALHDAALRLYDGGPFARHGEDDAQSHAARRDVDESGSNVLDEVSLEASVDECRQSIVSVVNVEHHKSCGNHVSHEAASLAGTLKLGGLVVVYDFNNIQIEGQVTDTNRDNAKMRFQAYGWKVFECDGHDFEQIERAYRKAEKVTDVPVLIIAKTVIGKGAPTKAGDFTVQIAVTAKSGAVEKKDIAIRVDPLPDWAVGTFNGGGGDGGGGRFFAGRTLGEVAGAG